MKHVISIEEARSYSTEANLDKALTRLGLDDYTVEVKGWVYRCRYMKVRNSEGRWTAIFLVSEFMKHSGGYIGFASQYGFMSI